MHWSLGHFTDNNYWQAGLSYLEEYMPSRFLSPLKIYSLKFYLYVVVPYKFADPKQLQVRMHQTLTGRIVLTIVSFPILHCSTIAVTEYRKIPNPSIIPLPIRMMERITDFFVYSLIRITQLTIGFSKPSKNRAQ